MKLNENKFGYWITEESVFYVKDIPVIPSNIWNSIITLFHDYAQLNLEVHLRVMQHLSNKNWFCAIVPKQIVSVAKCTYDYSNCIELLTGYEHHYPDDFTEWVDYLQIHSHGKSVFSVPSDTDDIDELNKPGLYCVVSNLNNNKYTVCFTIVEEGRRLYVQNNQLSKLINNLNPNGENTNTFNITFNKYADNICSYINVCNTNLVNNE